MKRYWLILLSIVSSCLTSNGLQYEAMSEINQYHLARIRKGMSQRQVLQIMQKPYSYESFETDEEIYDVWFYVTRPTALDQTRMVPQNLTPLTFKNGVLVGTGYSYYYYAMKEQWMGMAENQATSSKPKKSKTEDSGLEKTLKDVPQKQAPAPTSSSKKGAPANEKLPPNVHIISQNEMEEKEHLSESCKEECKRLESPCGFCPQKGFGPDRFSVVSKGMTEAQIFGAFGEPMKHETFTICHDVYDAWFYDTIPSKIAKPSLVPQHQTILTFKNAYLISKDDETFFDLKKQAEAQVAALKVDSVSQPKGSSSLEQPALARLAVTSKKIFTKLKKGMGESEVMERLGAADRQDKFSIQDDTYTVWFYQIETKRNQPSQTVPVIFKNGILIGTDMKQYEDLKNKTCKDCYDERGERIEQDESDQNFNYW